MKSFGGKILWGKRMELFVMVTAPLAWRSLITAYVLGLAGGLGEFGATVMFAGNIPKRTQTIPAAIYTAVDSGNWTAAWLWAGTMVILSFLLMWWVGPKAGSGR